MWKTSEPCTVAPGWDMSVRKGTVRGERRSPFHRDINMLHLINPEGLGNILFFQHVGEFGGEELTDVLAPHGPRMVRVRGGRFTLTNKVRHMFSGNPGTRCQ